MDDNVTVGLAVTATDGPAGRIDDVLSHKESGLPAYLVVSAKGFFGHDVVTPFESVESVDDDGVHLRLTRAALHGEPAYDPARHGEASGLISASAAHYKSGRNDE